MEVRAFTYQSFPVLARTGSGKLWLVQTLEVCSRTHPAGVKGGRESERGGGWDRSARPPNFILKIIAPLGPPGRFLNLCRKCGA